MRKIEKQIRTLYYSAILGSLSLTGAWVALLAARGFSLVEIGLLETIFHITSLIAEIPSGIMADVFGRKRMMLLSSLMHAIGNIIMIFSNSFFLIAIEMAFQALGYNFLSGSGEALAYDSFKEFHREAEYEPFLSRLMIADRFCSCLSTMIAGISLFIGYRLAYGADLIILIIQIIILCSLYEVKPDTSRETADKGLFLSTIHDILHCSVSSLQFFIVSPKAILLMVINSLVGAGDVLLLFFLQAKLPEAGMPAWAFGFSLGFMHLGGILGSRLILKCQKFSYRTLAGITGSLVILCIFAEHSSMPLIMTLSGFITAFCDDALQVRTNSTLQDLFPSEQRATLISVESFIFSMLMIFLSPLAGFFFTSW